MEPKKHAWILPGRLAVAVRPGGAGRNHRRERRSAELDWWRSQGVVAIVSALPTRHGLSSYVDHDFAVRWHPLRDPGQAAEEMPALVATVRQLLEADPVGAVLVHCDMANEWLAAIDASLRIGIGLACRPPTALRAAAADGLPVGSLATSILGCPTSAAA